MRVMPRRLRWSWIALVAVHLLALVAGSLAPHAPQEQHRDHPDAPPTRLRLRDPEGTWHLRPFVHPWHPQDPTTSRYHEDRSVALPVRMFVDGPPYRMLGRTWRTHLVGLPDDGPLYLLGTDALGRDQFSRLMHGAALSLTSALVAVVLTLGIAMLIGAAAGYAGGIVDGGLMFVADVLATLPWVYLLLALRAALPLDVSPVATLGSTVLALALVGWVRPARLIRTVVARCREDLHVVAARGLGATPGHVVQWHVLPAVAGVVLTQAAILAPRFIVAEVTLAFLGLGPGEPTPSWGSMLGQAQQSANLAASWWLLTPAMALVPVCYIYYALADALHERMVRGE